MCNRSQTPYRHKRKCLLNYHKPYYNDRFSCHVTDAFTCIWILVAHQIYGVAHTINSANYMYFKALEKVLSLNHPQCINIFTGME